jgi:hypothetical protein
MTMVRSNEGDTAVEQRERRSRRWWLAGLGAGVVVVLAIVVLAVFQPQRLFIDTVVHEALPGLDTTASPTTTAIEPDPGGAAPSTTAPTTAPDAPTVVARGRFASIAHPTEGDGLLVRMPDGSHLVRLEQFRTDNGPDVWVGVSSAPAGSGDYASLRRLEPLKGNVGDQNYVIPADVDVAALRSVVIWCERFSVAFGDASIDPS